MGVNVQGMAFDTAKHFGHLHIEAELETYLGLSRGAQTAEFSDFAEAKNQIKEIVFNVFCLNGSHVHQLLH